MRMLRQARSQGEKYQFICSLSILRVHANIMLVSACFSDR